MRSQQFVVLLRLQSGFAVGRVTDDMGENILIRVRAGFPPVSVNIGRSQNHAVLRDDAAPDDIG